MLLLVATFTLILAAGGAFSPYSVEDRNHPRPKRLFFVVIKGHLHVHWVEQLYTALCVESIY